MNEDQLLAERFQEQRTRLRAVAYRILGSRSDAEDAVQEAWLRLSRSRTDEVDNLAGWLTTVVARVSLSMLKSRRTRREVLHDNPFSDEVAGEAPDPHPEDEALLADTMGPALLLILDTLEPAERLAFVLHDMFAVPFDEIARIVSRSPVAARQLASRARRRVQGAGPVGPSENSDRARHGEVVAAFLAASRNGEFEALLALLDPDVVLRADATTVQMGSPERVSGAAEVAQFLSGRAQAARLVLIDGRPGAVWTVRGELRAAFEFTVRDGRIAAIDMVADSDVLDGLEVVRLPTRANGAGH